MLFNQANYLPLPVRIARCNLLVAGIGLVTAAVFDVLHGADVLTLLPFILLVALGATAYGMLAGLSSVLMAVLLHNVLFMDPVGSLSWPQSVELTAVAAMIAVALLNPTDGILQPSLWRPETRVAPYQAVAASQLGSARWIDVEVATDTMAPTLAKGTMLRFDRFGNPERGDIVAVAIGDDDILVARFQPSPAQIGTSGFTLTFDNASRVPIQSALDNLRILGTLVQRSERRSA